ncbi:MAG TPA: hypothetical protein HPP83_01230 [Candidatus Hydrogenedentes bacterium]|nr:hypothetical protein [Candidatus Hydrogenedentota bacterium]
MDARTRFQRLMRFESVDRLPVVEWATWWDLTLDRWRGEGLPADLTDQGDIRAYFGLDPVRQMWVGTRKASYPQPPAYGQGVLSTMDDYEKLRDLLYPEPEEAIDFDMLSEWAKQQAAGNMIVWITFEGFFDYPRSQFGIEKHFYAFIEQPETMAAMNADLAEHMVSMLDALCDVCTPDFMTFAEDMSYNNGPMISRDLFDRFMAPYYRQVVPELRKRGIIPFIDSDGDIEQLIPWFLDVGIDGFLPLERQAGCDIVAYREQYPQTRFIGAFNKLVMHQGEGAMRAEFERLLPAMKEGGYIPSVDHQTPPAVSMADYRLYLELLREYCAKAVKEKD